MSGKKLLQDFVDSDPKLLIGWESQDISANREQVLLTAIREARRDLHGFGITSSMRHAFNSYILVFKPAGDILDVMKLNMAVSMLRDAVRAAKKTTEIERAQVANEGEWRVEQMPGIEDLLEEFDVESEKH